MTKYNIEVTDIGVDYADEGPWRSYSVEADGNNLYELMENAYIAEIDQDGGELRFYKLYDSSGEVFKYAVNAIEREYLKQLKETL